MASGTIDLIRSIDNDDADVPVYSESSESEDEAEGPKKKKKRLLMANKDFNFNFQFIGHPEEYNQDTWNDLAKYVKRKGNVAVDSKIEKKRETQLKDKEDKLVENGDEVAEIMESSDEEYIPDHFRDKESKRRKKDGKTLENLMEEDDEELKQFFDECSPCNKASSFQEMSLSRPLMKALTVMGFSEPTPIQASAIPVGLMGRDICGCAATGTGKTAAFMLPVLERLLYRPAENVITRVLVLVPTRELGVQVYQVSRQLAQFTSIDIALAVGGLDLKVQEAKLRNRPDVVIATPGRLIDHLQNTQSFSLDTIEVLILDEADRMLDEYFAEQMKEIIRQCCTSRQTMLFSATMSEKVKDLAAVSLKKPVKLFVNQNTDVAFNLRQEFVRIRDDSDRECILSALLDRTFFEHVLVFTQTKRQAHRMHILLGLLGMKVGELHGNLSQPQRLEALRRFKDREIDILCCTDVAARGLDIDGVKTVVNLTLPATLKHYIHRVGRTARAGKVGRSVSLVGEGDRKIFKEILKRAKEPVKNRILSQDVVNHYRGKVKKLEPSIEDILKEEVEEREMKKLENKTNKAEKLLKGEIELEKRTWFQTHRERMEEKERLRLGEPVPAEPTEKKEKKKSKLEKEQDKKNQEREAAKQRIQREVDMVAAFQARDMKRSRKQKRIMSCVDDDDVTSAQPQKKKRKKKRSAFDEDTDAKKPKKDSVSKNLTDTSSKFVRGLRLTSSKEERMEAIIKKSKKGKKFKSKARYKRR